jgi:hypothetical protein
MFLGVCQSWWGIVIPHLLELEISVAQEIKMCFSEGRREKHGTHVARVGSETAPSGLSATKEGSPCSL